MFDACHLGGCFSFKQGGKSVIDSWRPRGNPEKWWSTQVMNLFIAMQVWNTGSLCGPKPRNITAAPRVPSSVGIMLGILECMEGTWHTLCMGIPFHSHAGYGYYTGGHGGSYSYGQSGGFSYGHSYGHGHVSHGSYGSYGHGHFSGGHGSVLEEMAGLMIFHILKKEDLFAWTCWTYCWWCRRSGHQLIW